MSKHRASGCRAILAGGLGVFVAVEVSAGPRGPAVGAMYAEAAGLAVTAQEAERALAQAAGPGRRDIVAGLEAALGCRTCVAAGESITPTKAPPR